MFVIKRGLPILKAAVPLILAWFIGRMIHGNWQQVRSEPWRLDLGWLAVSFSLGAAWHLVRPLGWARLLQGFDHAVPYWPIYLVYRKSELSRYVPGGIWQFAARIYLTRRYGVSAAACLAATLLDMTLAVLAAAVVAAWLGGASSAALEDWQRYALFVAPLLGGAVVCPPVFNAWAARLARLLKQPFRPLEIGSARMLGIWAMYVATWALLAFAMASFAKALLPDLQAERFAQIAGCYALAWVAALLTMVAPAGMGVREGILGILLAQAVATGTAMILAVAMRLWAIAMELAWLVVGLLPRTAKIEQA